MRVVKDYFNEKAMKDVVGRLLQSYGSLTIGELKAVAYGDVQLAQNDVSTLPSSDTTMRFEKILGNIVSHQEKDVEFYPEGFMVDKSKRPAVFVASYGKRPYSLGQFARKRAGRKTIRK